MTAASDEGLFSEDLQEDIRSRFLYVESDPFSGERIWLESASGSLRLKSMVAVLAEQTALADQLGRANPGSKHAGDVVARGIEDVRLFLGAESGVIMPAMSSTHAMFRAVHAIMASAAGTNVVTTDLEHPSVYDSTRQFAKTYGKEWRVAHMDPQRGSVSPDAILEKVDKDTCMIGMIHGSNITGAVLDVKTVAEETRKISPDVCVVIDGVQYAPHAPVDVESLGADAYIFGPYKAFCVKGIGFAYLSDRVAPLGHWALRGKAETDWMLGSPEDPTYAAWSAVVEYLCWLGGHFTESTDRRTRIVKGLDASENHLRALLRRAVHGTGKTKGLMHLGHVTRHGMTDDLSDRLCLVLFSLAGMDSFQAVELYNRARVRMHNRTRDAYSMHALDALGVSEGVRLSACHYNTPREIDRFLEVTAELGKLSAKEIAAIPGRPHTAGHGEG